MLTKLIHRILKPKNYLLQIPANEEFEGILILGDPGVGKSQIIHQILGQLSMRGKREAVVCFDPSCEFQEAFYNPATDIVLNPLDKRSCGINIE